MKQISDSLTPNCSQSKKMIKETPAADAGKRCRTGLLSLCGIEEDTTFESAACPFIRVVKLFLLLSLSLNRIFVKMELVKKLPFSVTLSSLKEERNENAVEMHIQISPFIY